MKEEVGGKKASFVGFISTVLIILQRWLSMLLLVLVPYMDVGCRKQLWSLSCSNTRVGVIYSPLALGRCCTVQYL